MSSLFILGGARSGKSRHAQDRAEALPGTHIYIATAQAWDMEMEDRIARHRADRGPLWSTIEAPLALPETIRAHSDGTHVLLIDCLTLWATNLMLGEQDAEAATDALCDAIRDFDGHIILVANEVGLGIVPENALARAFRDVAGRMNQRVAAIAEEAVFIAAGLPLRLK
jgi:adenosylcobinamide kinase/adenosylcobinamide-phosphate guanylyltransferase